MMGRFNDRRLLTQRLKGKICTSSSPPTPYPEPPSPPPGGRPVPPCHPAAAPLPPAVVVPATAHAAASAASFVSLFRAGLVLQYFQYFSP